MDNLQQHLKAHAGLTKRKKVFTCTECKKDFYGATLLQIHMRTHTGRNLKLLFS